MMNMSNLKCPTKPDAFMSRDEELDELPLPGFLAATAQDPEENQIWKMAAAIRSMLRSFGFPIVISKFSCTILAVYPSLPCLVVAGADVNEVCHWIWRS